jgi:hypothetical protein
LALYFVWYNWIRKHKTTGTTPAIAAGLTDEKLEMADVVRLIDKRDEDRLGEKRAAMFDARDALARKLSYSNGDTTEASGFICAISGTAVKAAPTAPTAAVAIYRKSRRVVCTGSSVEEDVGRVSVTAVFLFEAMSPHVLSDVAPRVAIATSFRSILPPPSRN